MKYASDDTDDLLGSIITNKHSAKKQDKPKGAVDQLVQDAYEKAMKDAKQDSKQEAAEKAWVPSGQQEQWKQLMTEPDPLEETDIYATVKDEHQEEPRLM